MRKKKVYAVLLAGGKGTRLWPLSTEDFSKSFVRIGKGRPLVLEAINRLKGLIDKKHMIVVVDKLQEKVLKKTVRGLASRNILVEPFGRSTASAVGLAAIGLKSDDVMVVLPTDAFIEETGNFRKALKSAVDFAQCGDRALLCVGTRPKEPTSAYGYIKIGKRRRGAVYSIDKFVEKPDKARAAKLIKTGGYLWNAGMFVFKAGDILAAIKKHAPLLYAQLQRIKKKKKNKKNAYLRMKNVSIDYQIMEKARNLYCVKADFSWRDLGNWRSLSGISRLVGKKDNRGNVRFGKVLLLDTRDSIVYNAEKGDLGVVGLNGMVVVRTGRGTLVCSKKDAEKVKGLVCRF